ncbi:MAG TPA: HAMP domain-containing sensor histidine kinase [Arachnia sp.]|nr:HAMP domain-containing sensor histidine kinase [Arachnia sp.]
MSAPRRGTLAAQLQPRIVVTVAVMAVLMCLATVLGARGILVNQLDRELDSAQRRSQGPNQDFTDILRLRNPGTRVGTVVAVLLPDGTGLGKALNDPGMASASTEVVTLTTEALRVLIEVPADGAKHTIRLPDMGEYRVEARERENVGTVFVALPTSEINRSLLWLGSFAGSVALVAVVVVSLVTREVVGRAVKPLVALTNTADEVSRLELEKGAVEVPRVDAPDMPEDSEVTRLSTAFNQMLDRVEGALTAREESEVKLRRFVADASHELRNPLAAIRGYAELADRSPDGADSSFALGRIGAESQRMSKLVGDLLLLARLDADARVEARPVDAVEVVLNAVSDAQAASRDHEWQLELPDAEVTVLADPDQLHQVMVNLLANARTHTPAGTTVRTSVRTDGGMAVIEVIDDGPGIPADALARVFERFGRADDARAHSPAQSTGLGLAIVRAVVEGFGGTATVESRPSLTRFAVRLPLA